MPFELNRLLEPLSRSASVELEASDERLLALDALADRGDFVGAARGVEELLEAQNYDLRPLPYYLYQAFVTGGYPALLTIFKVAENLLGPSYAALVPEQRRDDYLNRRLHWLFDKIEGALAYHDKSRSPEWARWRATSSRVVIDDLLLAGGRLSAALGPQLYQRAGVDLGRLLARIRDQKVIDQGMEAAKMNVEEASVTASVNSQALAPGPMAAPHGDGMPRIELAVSPKFLQLCRSLEAFEVLVRKEQFLKAAVVLADITDSLKHFDPRAHFPGMFGQFAALCSKHVHALTQHADEDSPAWLALRQHYQVDLHGFVES